MRIPKSLFLIAVLIGSSCSNGHEDHYVPREPVVQQRSVKRGVAFGFQFEQDIDALAPGISWSYNWRPSQNSALGPAMDRYEIDFCPMAWNGINTQLLSEYISRNPDCEYLLAFNEPNLVDQANITPEVAAERWPDVKAAAEEHGLKIISPAMNYGTLEGYEDPIVWLDEFFELVPLSDVEGIAVHCYMTSPGSLKAFLDRFDKYGKPIWLTEFCAWDGPVTPESQERFMADVLNYLESDPRIFRYSWFIPRGNGSADNFPYMFLLENSANVSLTALGKIYTQMSTLDKETFYVEQQTIEAEHYSDISVSEAVGIEGWSRGPQVRVTTEAPNESLELYNFFTDQWVEYQVEMDRSKDFTLEIRYASFADSELEIWVDGNVQTTIPLPSTEQDFIWRTATTSLDLTEGKHTIRLVQQSGTCSINWLRIV
ncbi:glycosyl hydrolase [Pontibacter sp. G13]|uniref:glycosyl hydrolase n=1 Tax=Pontibacter sp. G13 TaxID=3074898 RepID=UPI00288B6BD8|nr:glycosyl hydrolase [Pontibacter sp. G13]WNJ19291.1 glycosyl hydrolase [Pontibacter sp. G13]